MDISNWIRTPFEFLGKVLKFLTKNLESVIIIVIALIIIYFIYRFFKMITKDPKLYKQFVKDAKNQSEKDEWD